MVYVRRDSNRKKYCGVVPTLFDCFFRISSLHASSFSGMAHKGL